MYFNVKSAEYQEAFIIKLGFEDGSVGTVNLADYADPDNVFKRFLDNDYFKNFRIEFGTLVWGDGELDIAPETLYEKATRERVAYHSREKVV